MKHLRWILLLCLFSASVMADDDPLSIVKSIGFDQNLNREVPGDLSFTDESGRNLQLKSLFGTKPVLLVLVYHKCPMLCGAELSGLVTCLRAMSFSAGQEFDVVTVSFDPTDTPEIGAQKKQEYLRAYARPGSENGWHFLTGSKASIDALTHAVGFRYRYDSQAKQFAHASGIVVLTPQGRISRYFFGIEYYPRDLNLALIEASKGSIGGLSGQALLYCFRYNPLTGKYGLIIVNVLKLGGILTVLLLVGLVLFMVYRERKQRFQLLKARS